MSVSAIAGGWAVFWVQLPVLVLAVVVIIVTTTALRRARPQDVPNMFEAFAAAFGRRPTADRRRRHKTAAQQQPAPGEPVTRRRSRRDSIVDHVATADGCASHRRGR
ncbi:hypothetical protein [Nocardia sp. NPDC019395]|uniref:hypothetical protein n=1 Tax=Nocardia sp. NPDC019395 TaxID=3154686 RepID=UPI0033EA70A1